MAKRRRRVEPSDPLGLGGDIAGPGGPFDADGVVVDTRRAVLLDACHVALVANEGSDERHIALLLAGRVNRADDRASVLFLMDTDGGAAIVSELAGLMSRATPAEARRFQDALSRRLNEMPRRGTT